VGAGVLSVVAAAFYTVGLAMQQLAGAPDDRPSGRIAKAMRIAARPLWLSGFGLTVVGFLTHGVALSFGSLAMVQILQTSQIVFVVPIGARITHTPIQRRDWYGAAMVVAGLAALLIAMRPSEDAGAGTPDGWALTIAIGVVAVAALFAVARAYPRLRAALLGLAAGVVFGIEGATLKIASDGLADGLTLGHVVAPAVWSTLALGLAGVVIQNMALQAGRLSVALSTLTIATPITSTIIAVALFGENLDITVATVAVAAVAGVVASAGVMLLAQTVEGSGPRVPPVAVTTVAG
jgi:drug/metabolite transporter (DMT)-like permease